VLLLLLLLVEVAELVLLVEVLAALTVLMHLAQELQLSVLAALVSDMREHLVQQVLPQLV
jgi:hypothetical protein